MQYFNYGDKIIKDLNFFGVRTVYEISLSWSLSRQSSLMITGHYTKGWLSLSRIKFSPQDIHTGRLIFPEYMLQLWLRQESPMTQIFGVFFMVGMKATLDTHNFQALQHYQCCQLRSYSDNLKISAKHATRNRYFLTLENRTFLHES